MNCENCGSPLEEWQYPDHIDTPAICGGCYHRAVALASLLSAGRIDSNDTVLIAPAGLDATDLAHWQQRAADLLGGQPAIVSQ